MNKNKIITIIIVIIVILNNNNNNNKNSINTYKVFFYIHRSYTGHVQTNQSQYGLSKPVISRFSLFAFSPKMQQQFLPSYERM